MSTYERLSAYMRITGSDRYSDAFRWLCEELDRRCPEIPSATEAAERSPEPAQTTPAKDSG